MSLPEANLPDFSNYGYEILEKLGTNIQGGRATYKAKKIVTGEIVVIKQFLFATKNNSWEAHDAIKREINILQKVDHHGVPKFLGQIDHDQGLCLVQQYIDGKSLSQQVFKPDDIKIIAIQVLEILQYLQEQCVPPLLHRDIKPDNILIQEVEGNFKVFLIDFGGATIGQGSTMMTGTEGFSAREQSLGKATKSSDNYSLGVTLYCLITGKSIPDEDFFYRNKKDGKPLKEQLPTMSFRFIQWLEKMVEEEEENRYPDARTALNELKPLYVNRVPEIKFATKDKNIELKSTKFSLTATSNISNDVTETTLKSEDELNFFAPEEKIIELRSTQLAETLTTQFNISNNVPDTVLQSELKMAQKPNDTCEWIYFPEPTFKKNNFNCVIKIDTSPLRAGGVYEREIIFSTNCEQKEHKLKLRIHTAPIPGALNKPPLLWLTLLFIGTIFTPITVYYTYQISMNQATQIKDNLTYQIERLWR